MERWAGPVAPVGTINGFYTHTILNKATRSMSLLGNATPIARDHSHLFSEPYGVFRT